MLELSKKSVMIYDYGNFFPVAKVFAKFFGTVYYYAPYVINGFPEHAPIDIGRNVPNIIRIKEWGNVVPNVDMVFFCDCHEPEQQMFFQDMGLRVFGSRHGSELENDRELLKQILIRLGLPVSEYKIAKGLDELDKLLQKEDHGYVKSGLRGDGETWEHEDYRLSKYEIDDMRAHLNVFQTQPKYVLDKHIKGIGEIGRDLFVVDGRYPEIVGAGMEKKDMCYVMKLLPYMELPKQLRDVTDKLAPIFADYEYKGWFSDEVIIGEDMEGYLVDATCRLGQPPTDIVSEMITNFAECAYNVASGIVPKLEYDHTWGVQLIIKSSIAEKRASPIVVPDEYKDKVKIKNLVIDENGTWVFTPNGVAMQEIGSVVSSGNTLNYAMESAEEIASSIKGLDIRIDKNCLKEVRKSIEQLNKAGVKFLM